MEAEAKNKELLPGKTDFFEGEFSAPPELSWHHKIEGSSFVGLLIMVVGEGPVLADRFLVEKSGPVFAKPMISLFPKPLAKRSGC